MCKTLILGTYLLNLAVVHPDLILWVCLFVMRKNILLAGIIEHISQMRVLNVRKFSMKKIITTSLLLLVVTCGLFAQACPPEAFYWYREMQRKTGAATDQYDVLNYHINLDIRDFSGRTINGYTDVHLKSKTAGLTTVKLDLLKLNVTGISYNKALLNYTYNDTLLTITVPTQNTGDTFTLRVNYNGKPQQDKSWGGFYFSGVYAYNMGVGFDASPHTYGRVWFPCVDTFTSRSFYKFSITTTNDKRAMCNGLLKSSATNPDSSITWHWEMAHPIPTYLASVAVAPYAVAEDTYTGVTTCPITLAAPAADTAKMLASFIHLKNAIAAYEKWYGPHRFERVGFTMVPFSGGAMEHATNIAYPRFAVDGKTTLETLMAHELAHHWWGDNTTTRTGEDMWLNEGWASYSEYLFLEEVYGKTRSQHDLLSNRYDVLRWAHHRDGKPWPVSGIKHAQTYGPHVYNKGADMVHTLRGYMGDAAFMTGCKDFQEKKKFSDVSSEDLKSILQPHTSASLNDFFANWIYEAGFPAFSAYIVSVTPKGGMYECTVKVHQQLKFTYKQYKNVPLELYFSDNLGNSTTVPVTINRADTLLVITTAMNPTLVIPDPADKLSDAVTAEEKMVHNDSTFSFDFAMVTGKVNSGLTKNTLLRIEHYWTAPVDGANPNPGLYPSGNRYWRVEGMWADSMLDATCTLTYEGNTPGTFESGWLDNGFIKQTEDSLRLMYRKNPASPWMIYPFYTLNTGGSKTDKVGSVSLSKLLKGEYVFGMYDKSLGKPNDVLQKGQGKLEIYPNPANGIVKVSFEDIYRQNQLTIMDNSGRTVQSINLFPGQNTTQIDTAGWSAGIYYVSIGNMMGKLVVE